MAKLDGPVTGGRGWPFGSLEPEGLGPAHVLEEWFVDGEAASYALAHGAAATLDGRWETVPAEVAPFRTRLQIVRPADPSAFNGVVVVNWQNVTIGVDLGVPDLRQLARGYAWIGVTTQRVAIDGQPSLNKEMPATRGLRDWDPVRYGSLHHPGDAFSYDIFSQVGRLLRGGDGSGSGLLGGLSPKLLVATGGSQSAMRLGSYLNIAHQRDRVFDGFLLTGHWGLCPPPPDLSLVESFQLTDEMRFAASSQIRDDGGVPILVVNSESETSMMAMVRQPESDTFRFWEMAGTAHAGSELGAMTDLLVRDGVSEGLPLPEDRNTVMWDYVADAALERLVEWIGTGRPPASVAPLELGADGSGIRRDETGNAVGGIRLPDLEAPLAVHSGTNSKGALSALMGESIPFTPDAIAARYPDQSVYLRAWDTAVDDLASQGLVEPSAAIELRHRGRVQARSLG
jgi:hypothetical protein